MYNCKKCSKSFDSETGLNVHFGLKHEYDKESEFCEDKIQTPPSRDRRFCSKECFNKWADEVSLNSGQSNGNWSGKVEKKCEVCDKNFEVYKSNSDAKFCSKSCAQTGEHSNSWQECITKPCKECGEDVEMKPHEFNKKNNVFCSNECRNDNLSKRRTGKDNPNWVEDSPTVPQFRVEWRNKRIEAIQRDNKKCVNCGIGREEHKNKYGIDLHVDHIKPRKEFIKDNGDFDYKKANKLDNLRTVCCVCHRKVENGL